MEDNTVGLKLMYFVLKPHGTSPYANASRIAMHSYARAIKETNPTLAKDLSSWATDEGAEAHLSNKQIDID